jgi:DNA-binding transcriptional ArsR family regulator
MSNRYITAAMECNTGSSTKKLILIKLADNANDDGVCWPSYTTIARHCEVDKRTVMRHIKDMQERGILTSKKRFNSNGQTTNYYQINLPSLAIDPGVTNCHRGVTEDHRGGDMGVTGGVTQVSLRTLNEPKENPNNNLSSQAKDEYDEYNESVKMWNAFAESKGLKTVQKITKSRATKINTAYKYYRAVKKDLGKEPKSKVEFLIALVDCAIVTHKPFYLGLDGGWQMDFDFLLQKKTVEYIAEHGEMK